MQSLNVTSFKIAVVLSLVVAVALFYCNYSMGKNEFFLALNTNLGTTADIFFECWTFMGDALLWIPLLTFIWLKKRPLLPLFAGSLIITTIITQVTKHLIFPSTLRPTKAITNGAFIHTVTGVEIHTIQSFPSGHTATAFVFYLLLCLLISNRLWIVIGLILALLVGYSRVYLAQHFPLDVAGGIIDAIITLMLALKLQQWWINRKAFKK